MNMELTTQPGAKTQALRKIDAQLRVVNMLLASQEAPKVPAINPEITATENRAATLLAQAQALVEDEDTSSAAAGNPEESAGTEPEAVPGTNLDTDLDQDPDEASGDTADEPDGPAEAESTAQAEAQPLARRERANNWLTQNMPRTSGLLTRLRSEWRNRRAVSEVTAATPDTQITPENTAEQTLTGITADLEAELYGDLDTAATGNPEEPAGTQPEAVPGANLDTDLDQDPDEASEDTADEPDGPDEAESTAQAEAQAEALQTLADITAELEAELYDDLDQNPDEADSTTQAAIETAVAGITAQRVSEKAKQLLQSLRGTVPTQTMLLTVAQPLAKAALGMLIRSEAKGVATIALSKVLGAGALITPAAAALIAAGADTVRVVTGGSEAMYKSAAQNTGAALTTGFGRELTGRESQQEFEKNRIDRKLTVPIKLLRKVGVVMNALRSATTQGAYGVTVARSEVSKELDLLSEGNSQLSTQELKQKILDQYTTGSLSTDRVLELGQTLARLRSMGNYGDIDVYGAKGSSVNEVSADHTPELMKQLHEALNEMIQSGELSLTASDKDKWNREYVDITRKKKDKLRKIAAITGTALATFYTLGAVYTIPLLIQKIEDFDFEKWKAAHADEIEVGVSNALADGLEGVETEEVETEEVVAVIKADKPEVAPPQTTGVVIDDVPEVIKPEPEDIPDTPVIVERPETEDVPEVGDLPEVREVAETPVATAADAVELRNLGNDQAPWDAIMSSIRSNPDLEVYNINGTTNVIKNLYKALNTDDMGVITPDSTFAIPNVLGTDLPEGATGWFFSEDQIGNLAPEIDAAITAFNNGEELTEVQELLVNLNSSSEVIARSIDELNSNPELFQQIMDIANEG